MPEQDTPKWTELPVTDLENYLSFHRRAYVDDIEHAEAVALTFPRWSIISGYYAMHDVTKLFLATMFAIKISSPAIHEKTIAALQEKIQDKETKEKLLKLLKNAKEAYFNVERLKENVLPVLLQKGKQERGKSQYYTEDYSETKQTSAQKALYFLDTFAKPYIQMIEGLLK